MRASHKGLSPEGIIPVFIGGCGRSGTTMLGAMLGNYTNALCTCESMFKADLLKLFNRNPMVSDDDIYGVVTKSATANVFNFSDIPNSVGDKHERMRKILNWFVCSHMGQSRETPPLYWIDHTPHNISISLDLRAIFPEAKFIHIIRDGRAVAASMRKVRWGPNTGWAVAHEWVKSVGIGIVAEEVIGNQIMRVRYEDILLDPKNTMLSICEFLGWEYSDDMVVASGYSPFKSNKEQHALIGNAPQVARIDAWRYELPASDLEAFEAYAGNMLELLGYPLVNAAPRYPSEYKRAKIWIDEKIRVVYNKYKLRERRRRARKAIK